MIRTKNLFAITVLSLALLIPFSGVFAADQMDFAPAFKGDTFGTVGTGDSQDFLVSPGKDGQMVTMRVYFPCTVEGKVKDDYITVSDTSVPWAEGDGFRAQGRWITVGSEAEFTFVMPVDKTIGFFYPITDGGRRIGYGCNDPESINYYLKGTEVKSKVRFTAAGKIELVPMAK